MQDSPAERLGLEARRLIFSGGYAHPVSGTLKGLANITPETARTFWQRYGAGGSVLAVVADAEPDAVFELAEQLFGDWQPGQIQPEEPQLNFGLRAHIHEGSQQTHFTFTGRGVSPHSPGLVRLAFGAHGAVGRQCQPTLSRGARGTRAGLHGAGRGAGHRRRGAAVGLRGQHPAACAGNLERDAGRVAQMASGPHPRGV